MSAADDVIEYTDEILSTYERALHESDSPLVATIERWQGVRAQAKAILSECVRALGGNVREQPDPYALTRELGIQQMQQQILIADSIHASTLLWRAAVPVLRKILTDYGPAGCERLPDVLETLQDAISIRLYIGSLAYEHARPDSHAPVLDGYHRCCPGRGASEIVPRPENITEREWQVMECVSRALSNHEIAKELALSEPTVKAHLRKVFRKVGATSRVDAINKVGLAG